MYFGRGSIIINLAKAAMCPWMEAFGRFCTLGLINLFFRNIVVTVDITMRMCYSNVVIIEITTNP